MVLKGKNAVITGGSRGIGRVIAEEFLKEGASICLLARNAGELAEAKKELESRFPDRIFYARADVSRYKEMDDAYAMIKNRFGAVDILVNAAGILGALGSFSEMEIGEWERAIRVNFFGTAYAMRTVLPDMIKKGRGKIINFSGGGSTAPRPFFSSYGTAKTAVVRLTETVGEELRQKGLAISVNAIAPGVVNTRLLDQTIAAGPEQVGDAEYEDALKRKQQGGDGPARAAGLAVFLASSLSDGLTGRLVSAIWDKWEDIPTHLKEIMDSDIYTLRRIKPVDRGYPWK